MDSQLITQQTMNWIKSFIIEFNICPFAKHVVESSKLTIQVSDTNEPELALEALMASIDLLDNNPEIETILLVFPLFLHDFYDYLDFVEISEKLMQMEDYEGVYQLATFHPDYCFADVATDAVSNYTNRSPYPMLHILREESIEKAIEYYGNTDQIPENNIATMNKLGIEKIKKLLSLI